MPRTCWLSKTDFMLLYPLASRCEGLTAVTFDVCVLFTLDMWLSNIAYRYLPEFTQHAGHYFKVSIEG